MTAKQLREALYRAEEDTEVVILNENAPIKAATPVKGVSVFQDAVTKDEKLLIIFENRKEGNTNGR